MPLKWAYRQDEIPTYPGKGLMKYSAAPKRRGILADKEIEMLFRFGDWKGNEAARIATLVAYQTGLRAGEIVALRVGDVGADRLFVRHSYNRIDGLKSPKNGENSGSTPTP